MTQADNKMSDQSDEISLKDLIIKIRGGWRYLQSKWKIIVIAGIIGGGLGLACAIIKKPIYNAELNFALQDNSSSGGTIASAIGLAGQFGIDLGASSGGSAFSGDNLLELMKSRSMIEKTLLSTINFDGKKKTLAQVYIEFNHLDQQWHNDLRLKNICFLPNDDRSKYTLPQDSMLGVFYEKILKNNLSVDKRDKKLSIITVKVESKNELFSKYFAEILVKTVSDFYINTTTLVDAENVKILQHQTDSVRWELNQAISGVAITSDINPNPNPALQIIKVPSQRKQVDVQADIAILTELVKHLEISKVSLRKETPLIQIIDTPILPLKKIEIPKLIGTIAGIFIGGILAVIVLISRKGLKNLMTLG